MWHAFLYFYGTIIFIYSLGLILSYVMLLVLAYIHSSQYLKWTDDHINHAVEDSPYAPGVSIVAPAYNESKTIVDNVNSLLQLDYPNFEVVIVNDGSKDNTLELLIDNFELDEVPFEYVEHIHCKPFRRLFRSSNPKYHHLKVVDKVNGGTKADAVNAGLNVVSTPYFINTDVDCILSRDAIKQCIFPILQDSSIIAVSGTMSMSNGSISENGQLIDIRPSNQPIPLFQDLEYKRSFLIGKMGWSQINAMNNVSGGYGLFSTEVVLSAGGYASDSFAEDMDIITRMMGFCLEQGRPYRVVQIPHTCCWTEGPSTAKVLKRQRNRWGRGLIQHMWKHRYMLFNPKYKTLGMVTLPYTLVFEFLAPIIEGLGLFIMLILAFTNGINWSAFGFIMAAIYGFSLVLSSFVIFYDYMCGGSYNDAFSYVKLMIAALFEPIVYHPMIVLFSLQGYWKYLTNQTAVWGEMTRTGTKKKAAAIAVLCMLSSGLWAQNSIKSRLSDEKNKMQDRIEYVQGKLPDYLTMTLTQYTDTIRWLMNNKEWEKAKRYLDAADPEWGYTTEMHYLNGRFYYHADKPDEARRHLLDALQEDNSNTDALELLAKIEQEQGNYSTAIVHINDLLAFSPYNIRLWRKKIELYRLSNNNFEADRLLARLSEIYPEDTLVKKDVAYQQELKALAARKKGQEKEVQENMRALIDAYPSEQPNYYLDLVASLLREGKRQEAEEVCARGVQNTHGNRALIQKRVALLGEEARYQEAEGYLRDCIRMYRAEDLRPLLRQLQQEAAEALDANEPYSRYQKIYGAQQDTAALGWLIRSSMQRGYWDDAQYYIGEARKTQGDTPELLAKAQLTEQRLGNTRAANRLLEQRFVVSPNDADIREDIAEKRLREATDLMADEYYQQAIPLLEQADTLTTDTTLQETIRRRLVACLANIPDTTQGDSLSRMDWMERSIYYEKRKEYDSAYVCLMRYVPAPNEYVYVRRHGYMLHARTMKNSLSFEYQYSRRSSVDQWSHNAYATYSHAWKKDILEVSVAYAGRESSQWTEEDSSGQDSTVVSEGGSGVQIGAGYTHSFEWGDIYVQGAWASKFLPKGSAKLAITENLPAEWTLTERLSWRYITDDTPYHLFGLGLTAGWSVGQFNLSPTLDAYLLNKNVYFNGGFKCQFYPLDGDRSSVYAAVGAGNAPEVSLLDGSMPVRFAHINTNVSAGGYLVINGHLGLAASLSWYVIGSNNQTVRNYIYLNVSMDIRF